MAKLHGSMESKDLAKKSERTAADVELAILELEGNRRFDAGNAASSP